MSISTSELDKLQSDYHAAVDTWRDAIKHEEDLASVIHSEAQIDLWEAADAAEEHTRSLAKEAKKAYEDALREEFFNF
jgi:cyclopropane fatty-acyl-phospholipid synthase-like methyltransferase